MVTVIKSDIIDEVTKLTDLESDSAKNIVESLFENIKVSLENGDNVKISSFGNFSLLDKSERIGRNPKTGEETIISARRVVSFSSGKKLRSRVKDTKAVD